MKVKTLTSILGHSAKAIAIASAIIVGGLTATPVAASDIGPSRFAVRNCIAAKMLVCAYDKTDSILAIPYHAKYVKPGEKERFSCNSADKCKVFMGMSDAKIKEVLDGIIGQAIVGTAAGVALPVGIYAGTVAGVTLYLATTTAVTIATVSTAIMVAGATVGAVAAVGTVFAVTKMIDGLEVGKMCKKMMKDQKDIISSIEDDAIRQLAKDSRKVKVKTRWPKYKNYTMKTEQGVMVFEQGNDC